MLLEDILAQFQGLDEYDDLANYYQDHRRQLLKSILTIYTEKLDDSLVQQIEEYLHQEQLQMDITDASTLDTFVTIHNTRISIWKGDITKLKVDAIVNAANSAMLGCFRINHPCIDNAIHCAAGPGLRNECLEMMSARGNEPYPVGVAYLSKAYALPSRYVLHCVGPAARYPGHEQPLELRACYESCLDSAQAAGDIHSIAFCCISTGVFGYPNEAACEVALRCVIEWLDNHPIGNRIEHIVFNVFLEKDWEIYHRLGAQILK